MKWDVVEQQLDLIEQRLGVLEELLGQHGRLLSCAEREPTPCDSENLADAVSNLLLSIQRQIATDYVPGSAGPEEDLARRFSELDEIMTQLFNRFGAVRSQ